jgi:hypothetical protein
MLESLETDQKLIHRDISNVVYYMNGGLSLTDAYNCSSEQLKIFTDTISSHYEKQNQALNKSSKIH